VSKQDNAEERIIIGLNHIADIYNDSDTDPGHGRG